MLIALGPLISTQLNAGIRQAQLQGIALVLDAKLSPQQKLRLAPSLFGAVSAEQPLASLRTALAAHQSEFSGADLVAYKQFGSRSQTVLLNVVKRGFRWSFLITGMLAMLAAALLLTQAITQLARQHVHRARPTVQTPARLAAGAADRRGRRPRGLRRL